MEEKELRALAHAFIDTWNSQDVERVVACYTEDLYYRDPNTRGAVEGAGGMRRYLRKLFDAWRMHWSIREVHLLASGDGCAVLWHASFQREGRDERVEADGMDLVIVREHRIARNEVYFDRVVLAPLSAPR